MSVFIWENGTCGCRRDKCSDECDTYRRYKPKSVTNYDRIVSKSPYDLAEFLGQIMDCCWNSGRCGECDEDCPMYKCCNNQSSDNIEDWLKQEVQDG